MTIEIRELPQGDKKALRDFLHVTTRIYEGDPCFVQPLDAEVSDRLNHRKNPFFEHAEGTAFLAYRDGTCVGRISAQVDHEHLKLHQDEAGFFGFLDTIDDPAVARELLDTAGRWLAARGMKRMRGPFSLNINEESGCLVDGFHMPPMIGMQHHRPYQGGLIEAAGLSKLKDLFAWEYDIGHVPARAQRAYDEIAAMPEIESRPVDPKHALRDLRIIIGIFNDAWSDNWGFVPLTEKELLKMAEDTKLVLMPELTRIVSIDGEPGAVVLGLPNINDAIADLGGKLNPITIGKLLWRLKVRGPQSGRLVILGIRKKFRHVRRYAGLSAYLYVHMNRAAHLLGLKRSELSWTLEDNAPINVGIRLMGGRVYKTYRVYERELSR